VYSLEDDGKDEIREFFEGALKTGERATVAEMYARVLHLADSGTRGQPDLVFKRFKVDGEPFCEIKKKAWRIGCFEFHLESRLLLVTAFRKYGQTEKAEYERAVRQYRRFRANPEWRE